MPPSKSLESSFGYRSEGFAPNISPRSAFEICGPGSSCFSLTSARSFVPVAPPVGSLNIVWVIVSPCAAHSPWIDMVRFDIAVIRELRTADAAFSFLGNDLSIEQLSHLPVGAEFPVSPRETWILNSANAKLSSGPCFLYHFPPTAGKGTMDGADLIAAKSHDFPPDYG